MAFTRILPAGISTTGTVSLENVTASGIITATTFDGDFGGTSGIAEVSKTISDNPADVFVYDTSKDSDGGAWRYRTQHTSWYKETLNTPTRGSRREFPSVAVIVISNDNAGVTIYDGDDPDLPMWMVFNESAGQSIWTGTNRSSVTALNGIIVVGQLTTIPLPIIGFVADEMYNRRTNTTKYNVSNIANRHIVSPSIAGYFDQGLNSTAVNDLAMTVLPNAPIDDATGLPVPTIAVATNGGTSIIKDDGTVVDITATGYTATDNKINFDHLNNLLYLESGGYPQRQQIPSGDISRSAAGGRDRVYGGTSFYTPSILGASSNIISNSYGFATGSTSGLSILDYDSSQSQEMIAYATASYNTGYMQGDIKGAFLSDTDDTNAIGSELVTNGTFDSDTSNWTAVQGATLSISSNRLVVTGDGSTDAAGAAQSFTTVSGKKYVLTYVAYAGSINVGQVRIGTSANAFDITFDNSVNSNAYDPIYFTAVGTTTFITFGVNAGQATSGSFQYDNISVRVVEEDRSINNKGTAVYGTVTKSAVATGAELVAYSGFSGSNVLVQPYNSDLDPGTGDYSFMLWFKCSSTSSEQIIMRRFSSSSVTGGMMMRIVSSSSVLQWYVRDISSNATSLNSTIALDDGVWHCAVGTRQGGNVKLYIDGKLDRDSTCSGRSHNPGTDANLVIGAEETVGSPGTFANPANVSSLALVRYSLSVPTAEQVERMYNDEKHLFQENAKCTLYGSSDAVTALGYDEKNELLHVGTSSGRSDFQGLCRINNTTTAVTTAISAYDGSIAQQ